MGSLGTILTAVVTPFDDRLQVAEEAFVGLLHHLAAHGSDGAVVAGTTGEAPTLTDEEQLALIELAVQERPAQFTIVAGTGSNDTRHAVHLTERATELGVDGVLVVTPYYNRPPERGLIRHFEAIDRATDKPIVLYNIPSRTATNMGPELLARLAELEHVVAVKQANPKELQPIDGLELYAGNDDLFRPTLELGGAGGILVASHIVGERMRQMVDEPQRRAELDAQLKDVYDTLSITTNPIGIKAALNLLGFRVGGLRLPLVEADRREQEAIRKMLERQGLLAGSQTVPGAA